MSPVQMVVQLKTTLEKEVYRLLNWEEGTRVSSRLSDERPKVILKLLRGAVAYLTLHLRGKRDLDGLRYCMSAGSTSEHLLLLQTPPAL